MLGVFFTAGSPAGTKVSVGSLGRASMMLEDPKLLRTPRTSLTRQFCELFFKCLTTILCECTCLLFEHIRANMLKN